MIDEKSMNDILTKIGIIVSGKAKRLAPVDLGFLRSTIGYKVEGNIVRIFCTAEYAKDLEYGTPPGVLDETEKQQINAWAKRHNLFGPAVAKKIETEGIKVGTVKKPMEMPNHTFRPFFRPALYQSRYEIANILAEVLK